MWSASIYKLKDYTVGNNGERIVAFSPRVGIRGLAVSHFLEWTRKHMPQDATFVVLPDGVMLNYLTRRDNPTRYISFTMVDILAWGEEQILDDLKKNMPDYFVLVHRDSREFGVGYLGTDPRYAKRIVDWINDHYSSALVIGNEPLKDGRFGIKILEKNLPAPKKGKN